MRSETANCQTWVITRLDGLYKNNKHLGESAEDYLIGIAVTENGLYIPFSHRFSENQEEDYVFQIGGTKGILKVEGFKRCTLIRKDEEKILFEHDLSKPFRERHKPEFKAELEHFVRYLQGDFVGKESQNFLQAAVDA